MLGIMKVLAGLLLWCPKICREVHVHKDRFFDTRVLDQGVYVFRIKFCSLVLLSYFKIVALSNISSCLFVYIHTINVLFA